MLGCHRMCALCVAFLECYFNRTPLTPKQQPTTFSLNAYNLTHVFDTPTLIQSLSAFSESQENSEVGLSREEPSQTNQSVLFLHIRSRADFFTTNQTLMHTPPPVDVDIILDPFLSNILPQSLVATGIYITITAIAAWLLSGAIWRRLFSTLQAKQHRA